MDKILLNLNKLDGYICYEVRVVDGKIIIYKIIDLNSKRWFFFKMLDGIFYDIDSKNINIYICLYLEICFEFIKWYIGDYSSKE